MTWVLRHLRHAGFTEGELARVYKAVVRPVLDNCCVIYHPMLTDEQDQVIERLQSQALKNIYLWGAAAYQLGNTSSRTITEVKQR